MPIHKGFVVDKVGVGQVFISVLPFALTSIIPTMLHTHPYIATDSIIKQHLRKELVEQYPYSPTYNHSI